LQRNEPAERKSSKTRFTESPLPLVIIGCVVVLSLAVVLFIVAIREEPQPNLPAPPKVSGAPDRPGTLKPPHP
jgi:hypothetical protein